MRFISNAVMIGLMAGIGVTILLSQLGALTGFSSRYDNKVLKAADLFMHPGASDVETTIIGLVTVALVVALRRTRLKLFAMALPLLVMTVVVALLPVDSIAVVGDIAPIPRSLPLPQLPDFSLVPVLLVPALSLVIIGLVQGAGISRTVTNADGSFGDTSRDFVGQGVANVFSGVLQRRRGGRLRAGHGAQRGRGRAHAVVVGDHGARSSSSCCSRPPRSCSRCRSRSPPASSSSPRPARCSRAPRSTSGGRTRCPPLIMLVTFALVLVVPLQYAVLAGATISVLKYIYLASLDVHVMQVVTDEDGRLRETEAPPALASESVTVLDIYGSLFFAAAPKIRESLPSVGDAHCPVVVLRLRGRGTLHSATIALIREYAGECAAAGGGCISPASDGRWRISCGAPACSACSGPTRWWRRRTSSTAPARRLSSEESRGLPRRADRRAPGPRAV